MAKKKLKHFIAEHREELIEAISRRLNHVYAQSGCNCFRKGTDHYHDDVYTFYDDDLKQWVNNDEGLYAWMRSECGC